MQTWLVPLLLVLIQASYAQPYVTTDYPDLVTTLPNFTFGTFPTSYAGFAPLDSQNNSALFYWFFPANGQYSNNVPTLLWLNGGPGSSSLFGLFVENGPLRINLNADGKTFSVSSIDQPGKLQSWTAYYNVLYLDSPVGVGYSYTANNSYPTNEDEVANNIWIALQYFMNVHPETKTANWYYTGESYGGRYLPAIAYWTLQYNDQIQSGQLQGQLINLKGILVGDGFVLGVSQRITSIDASEAGNILTPNQYKQAKTIAAECQQLSGMGSNYTDQAVNRCNDILDYLSSVSSIDALALTLSEDTTSSLGSTMDPYLNDPNVIQALHTSGSKKQGQIYNSFSDTAAQYLNADVLGNSLNYINYILTRIQCLFFEGNLDAQDGSYGTYDWFKYLDNSYDSILNTTRNIWYINEVSAGMYTQYQNLTFLIVDFSGHFVPYFVLNASVKMVDIFTLRNNNWQYYSGFNPTPISKIMAQYASNCNAHGSLTSIGTCICNAGYGLADCSVKAEDIDTSKTYNINQRGYLFFQVPLNGTDMTVQFNNEGGVLAVYYSPFANGPVADDEEAEASLLADPNAPSSRTLYLNSYGNNVGYLTIQNTQYFDPVSFQIQLSSQGRFVAQAATKEDQTIVLGMNLKGLSAILYGLSALMLLTTILIIVGYKNLSKSTKRAKVVEGRGETTKPLVEKISNPEVSANSQMLLSKLI